MNKTINVNLANMFFHIDEDAYRKLHSYLEAIKHSLNNGPGSEEIISDIEGRIAELFQEKIKNEQQVITKSDVDSIISVMGQPEDYRVDEEMFEDELKGKLKSKKLYRDIENKYIGGISAGMAHYLGVNPWWVRLLWIVLTLATFSGFILIYILLLFLIPQAKTTAQKLDMRGESVNISTIERKVKESFNTVTDKVKNADYEKVSHKFKSSSQTFFDAIGSFFSFIFKSIGKIIGVFLILVGGIVLIGSFIGMFVVGFTDAFVINGIPFLDIAHTTNAPIWLLLIILFLLVCIPFFFLLYLGLKIVVSNLKSIGLIAKLTLLGLWLAAIIGATIIGVKQATSYMFRGSVNQTEQLHFNTPIDTLIISSKSSPYNQRPENIRINGMTLTIDDDGNKILVDNDFVYNIKKSYDAVPSLKIQKISQGSSFEEARQRAENVNYGYEVLGNTILLDNFLTMDSMNKIRDQSVEATLYIPEHTVLKFTTDNHRSNVGWDTQFDQKLNRNEVQEYVWKMGEDGIIKCLNCPVEKVEVIEKEIKQDAVSDSIVKIDSTQIEVSKN
ncbi:PspC domain-containing protein [Cellulophaga sp. F20128]|uniref:PspC domain-containing protein n=1 Tax=Cellulophaga sp. F20128 TaxID=2926413 RepID=UPI001FF5909D|nr:PspC domain-containing protein [Cellulophaga sp. F20128]MCK0157007.1 PspC domain-containing protein [Cellulophaga sp. F20128]